LAVGALGTLGLAVLAEALARRRAARPAATEGPVMPDAANPRTDEGPLNGSRKPGWSGILSAMRSAHREPTNEEPTSSKAANREPSRREQPKHEPTQRVPSHTEQSERETAWKKAVPGKQSKQESGWQKTAQQPSTEFPADNGHVRPEIDRSP
jgi:hypothetical protein